MATLDNYPFLRAMQKHAGTMPSQRGLMMSFAAVMATLIGLALVMYEPSIFAVIPFLVAAAFAFGVYNLWRSAKQALIKSIRHFGDFDTIATQIESNFAGQTPTDSPCEVGQAWFCYVNTRSAVVCPLTQCLWAYGEVDDINSPLIPKPQISMWTREGWKYDLQMEQYWVDETLPKLAKAAPWMPIGYNDAMRETWNADKRELTGLVDRARQEGVAFNDICPPPLRVSLTDTPKR